MVQKSLQLGSQISPQHRVPQGPREGLTKQSCTCLIWGYPDCGFSSWDSNPYSCQSVLSPRGTDLVRDRQSHQTLPGKASLSVS